MREERLSAATQAMSAQTRRGDRASAARAVAARDLAGIDRLLADTGVRPESPGYAGARSVRALMPCSRAQWAQQKKCSPAWRPWPMTEHPQWSQRGAMAWIAHSKESNTCVVPPSEISIVLS